jgi:GTP-dependent phosphoenolpyruvate carboxykinase
MANSISQNPIILDTVGATSAINGNVTISCVVWNGFSASATMELTNYSGNRTIVKLTAGSDLTSKDIHFDGGLNISDGIALKTLSTGTFTIYLSRS